MFLGHFALGFSTKKVEPSVSLGTALVAAQLPDVIWPWLVLAGVERVAIAPGDTAVTPLRFVSYPWSHSLLMVVVWGGLLAALHFASRRRSRAARWLWALAVSHWVLDFASHRPDMPLVPWSTTVVGLGLWDSVPATLFVELLLYAGGLWLYFGATKARDRVGLYAAPALAAILAILYLASVFGPPPRSVDAVAGSGVIGLLFVFWAVWADRHRAPVSVFSARDAPG
jgi:membrane-bound metal-dependent hydrolase YbcI (DUF457 family)